MKTIVNQLNDLAEKITGTNPKATTDKKALDFIADYYANEDLKPTTNAQAIQNITENFSAGGIDTSDATATESDIVKDKTAYAKGEKVTGTYEGIIPTGTISITSNGDNIDVSEYASANVNVSSSTTLLAQLENYVSTYSATFIPITLSTGQSGYNYYMFSNFQNYLKNNTTKGILIYYPNSTYSNEKYFFVQYYTGSMQPTEIYRLYSLKNHNVVSRFKYSQGSWTETNSDY